MDKENTNKTWQYHQLKHTILKRGLEVLLTLNNHTGLY